MTQVVYFPFHYKVQIIRYIFFIKAYKCESLKRKKKTSNVQPLTYYYHWKVVQN